MAARSVTTRDLAAGLCLLFMGTMTMAGCSRAKTAATATATAPHQIARPDGGIVIKGTPAPPEPNTRPVSGAVAHS